MSGKLAGTSNCSSLVSFALTTLRCIQISVRGLIRQSEFRTVAGGSANYVNHVAEYLSLLAGFDYQREAPRRDNLDHYDFYDPTQPGYYGPFTPVDSNNVTIGSYTPYIAAEGGLARYFRYYLGWRRDEINIDNEDLLHSENSFQKWVGVNSPKATFFFSSQRIVASPTDFVQLRRVILHRRSSNRHGERYRHSRCHSPFISTCRQQDHLRNRSARHSGTRHQQRGTRKKSIPIPDCNPMKVLDVFDL